MSFQLGKPCISNLKADFDSVTISWTTLSPTGVSGYKIKYRTLDESEFTECESRGTVQTWHVRGLVHGIKYKFKVQAISESGKTAESDCRTIETREYYDIVVVGKTGSGKSTLGNKLLNLDGVDENKIRLFESESHPGYDFERKKRFIQASDIADTDTSDSMLSVTGRCKLLANQDSNIRVLDVPGFSDSGKLQHISGKKISVKEGNLQIIRWIVRAQLQFHLKVRRIVYFLPQRGPLEAADGTFQGELSVLYHYFGKEVFYCMVVVATNPPKARYQAVGFDDDDCRISQMVFGKALKAAIPNKDLPDPPIEYIGIKDSSRECLMKIKGASVLKENILLHLQENTCARCSVKVHCNKEMEIKTVVQSDGTIIPYAESKCHPQFIQKYSGFQKFAGGIGHVLTLGIGLLIEQLSDRDSWPGFTNSDEKCIECNTSPGASGCTPVEKVMGYKDRKIEVKVQHVNQL